MPELGNTQALLRRKAVKYSLITGVCALLWLGIFLKASFLPHLNMFYLGLRDSQQSWQKRFSEHEQLKHFVSGLSSQASAQDGQIIVAYGGNPPLERIDDLMSTMFQLKYVLYPIRMHTLAVSDSNVISHIAIYHSEERIFRELPFCKPIGENDYICRINAPHMPLASNRIHARHEASHMTLVVEPGQEVDVVFTAVSFLGFPVQSSFDLNLLMKWHEPEQARAGENGDWRLRLYLPQNGPTPLPEYRFQVFAVDKNGQLLLSPEQRLVINSYIP